ncbi:hypothetical protein PIB30_097821, partial [Stylosanthes scabra]|nr:hypothetical protein [Stylosanthes scabra]
ERLRKALEAKGSQEEAKKHETGHRAVVRSYRATSRVLGSVFGCILPTPARPQGPIARPGGCEVKGAIFLTVRRHYVPRDRTVSSGRIKIKAKNGISIFRSRSKALTWPNSTYMKKEQLKHKGDFPLGSFLRI